MSNLAAALDPRSVAVIGASENPDKIGGRPLLYLARFGFRGEVIPVNPRREEVQGLRTVPRLSDLDRAPDLAIVAVPGEAAVAALDECGAMGVKVAIMMASGFGETDSQHGKAAERAMVARARARGMRVIGPNSQGLANFGTGAVPSFSSMFLEVPPLDGPVGIVSQSGAMSVVPYGLLRGRGIGVRHTHATGNDADVTVCELAAAVAEDRALKLLLLYLESIPDPHHLAQAAEVARSHGLPIVALKSGRTEAGQAAAQSHTGALANEDRVVDAFLEQHGIWRARDTADLVEAAELYLKGWRPEGRRMVAISNSGATCVMAADAASAAGLTLAPLNEATQGELRTILPSFASVRNPVDITAALMTNSALFSQILPVIARDPSADAFLVGVPVAGRAYDVDAFGRDTAAFAAETGKPVVIVAPQELVAKPFRERGLPVFPGEGAAVRALHQFVLHHERMQAAAARPRAGAVAPVSQRSSRLLDEARSLARLAEAGIPVVPHRLCRTPEEAVAAAAALGGPVAVKGCSPDVAHKSELGLVHLGLSGAAPVAAAFEACRAALGRHGSSFAGVIVAAMRRGRRELMLGAHRDAFFGPVVVVGDGGKYVEAMPDVALLLPPFDEDDVRRAIGRLRIAPVVAGTRGEPPLALDRYLAAAVAVGRLMTQDRRIASLDVNPIVVGSDPETCAALDAVVFESDEEEDTL
ncbi:Acyl-CoA synthetase (NDP forming) [Methylobacterium sp. 174MFSha1.1]|uniref:acetate--CoA ligase family protein n=1 Tax=Methylobacterium sp. 174MFSha1.1 TaxID=1502749 RepID=UPI0008EB8765|nr:acetate--CoA ligase family protein [Methylobacterium sp. 174MFSha1.1]SFU75993.1 Acyl-CoA synthetase (NDP forming) [Methylobacterium sp. 174MFSha1.1]